MGREKAAPVERLACVPDARTERGKFDLRGGHIARLRLVWASRLGWESGRSGELAERLAEAEGHACAFFRSAHNIL
jgi:hypothetical protein